MTHPQDEHHPALIPMVPDPAPGALAPWPGAHGPRHAIRAPGPGARLTNFDIVVSAVLDHLALIEQHQDDIAAHQQAIDAALTIVHSLVEEALP
jgi:hypothetical protein